MQETQLSQKFRKGVSGGVLKGAYENQLAIALGVSGGVLNGVYKQERLFKIVRSGVSGGVLIGVYKQYSRYCRLDNSGVVNGAYKKSEIKAEEWCLQLYMETCDGCFRWCLNGGYEVVTEELGTLTHPIKFS